MRYDLMSDSGSSLAVKDVRGASEVLSAVGNLTREELIFSFSTSHTPSVLIYVSSKTQDYMAVVLRHNGETRQPCLIITAFNSIHNTHFNQYIARA